MCILRILTAYAPLKSLKSLKLNHISTDHISLSQMWPRRCCLRAWTSRCPSPARIIVCARFWDLQLKQNGLRGFAASASRAQDAGELETFEVPCGSAGSITVECVGPLFSLLLFLLRFLPLRLVCIVQASWPSISSKAFPRCERVGDWCWPVPRDIRCSLPDLLPPGPSRSDLRSSMHLQPCLPRLGTYKTGHKCPEQVL